PVLRGEGPGVRGLDFPRERPPHPPPLSPPYGGGGSFSAVGNPRRTRPPLPPCFSPSGPPAAGAISTWGRAWARSGPLGLAPAALAPPVRAAGAGNGRAQGAGQGAVRALPHGSGAGRRPPALLGQPAGAGAAADRGRTTPETGAAPPVARRRRRGDPGSPCGRVVAVYAAPPRGTGADEGRAAERGRGVPARAGAGRGGRVRLPPGAARRGRGV